MPKTDSPALRCIRWNGLGRWPYQCHRDALPGEALCGPHLQGQKLRDKRAAGRAAAIAEMAAGRAADEKIRAELRANHARHGLPGEVDYIPGSGTRTISVTLTTDEYVLLLRCWNHDDRP